MEWYVRKNAIKSIPGQGYLTVEKNMEQLLEKRLKSVENGDKVCN